MVSQPPLAAPVNLRKMIRHNLNLARSFVNSLFERMNAMPGGCQPTPQTRQLNQTPL